MSGDELVVLWRSLLQDSDIHVVDHHLRTPRCITACYYDVLLSKDAKKEL